MENLTAGKKVLFSVLWIFLALAALELFFRLLPEPPRAYGYRLLYNPELDFPKFYLKDEKLFWRLRPKQHIQSGFVVSGQYRTNSEGFRDREFTENRAEGKKRILCLGNSVTFGWRVAEEEAYPQALQKLVADDYEVYNCAQTGYATFQGKRLLDELLQKYHPDVVTIAFIWNDLLPAANGIADSRRKMPPQVLLSAQNALAHLAIYRWGRFFFLKVYSVKPAASETPRVPLAEYRTYVQEMLDSCRAHQVHPILILPPAPQPEWLGIQAERYRIEFYEPFRQNAAVLKALASANRVPLVNADSALAGELAVWENLPEDFVHPSAQAHRKTAELLSSALAESKTPSTHK
ncbi:MAG: GDSL-type esterase/lipase family protein [candidate division Zixibacteria bacterium]|nr:GDSL-type esterase/lipase family protein [candidate division Zixibacteria bacterium]MCI0597273.1 GDSL-type esterase/lipase family protein [candidate division Zixibacteria bacterium]